MEKHPSELPPDIQVLIDTLFTTPDPNGKVTRDALVLYTEYHLSPQEWSHTTFMQMAHDRPWAPRTIDHRWGLFKRLITALNESGTADKAASQQRDLRPAGKQPDTSPDVSKQQRSRTRMPDSPSGQAHALMGSLMTGLRSQGWDGVANQFDMAVGRGILVSCRVALEHMLETLGVDLQNQSLASAINLYAATDQNLAKKMHLVRTATNYAAHRNYEVTWQAVLSGLHAWEDLANTLFRQSSQ